MTTIDIDIDSETGHGTGRRPDRGRRVLHAALTTVLAATAAGFGYGWYWERQWHPDTGPDDLADTTCTIAADTLLTVSYIHAPGDVVSVLFSPQRDRVLVGLRSEPVRRGPRTAIATTTSFSTVIRGGLGDRPVVLGDGSRLTCRAVELPLQVT